MALFGSIGIGPVRVGASTRGGGGSSNNGVAFVVCLAVAAAVYWWYVTFIVVGLALLVWAIVYLVNLDGDAKAEEAQKRAAIIARAEEQHKALVIDGDEQFGVHGEYPPAKL